MDFVKKMLKFKGFFVQIFLVHLNRLIKFTTRKPFPTWHRKYYLKLSFIETFNQIEKKIYNSKDKEPEVGLLLSENVS